MLLQSAPAKFLDDAVMGDGQTDERVGLRHNAGILGCDPEASQRIGANRGGLQVERAVGPNPGLTVKFVPVRRTRYAQEVAFVKLTGKDWMSPRCACTSRASGVSLFPSL